MQIELPRLYHLSEKRRSSGSRAGWRSGQDSLFLPYLPVLRVGILLYRRKTLYKRKKPLRLPAHAEKQCDQASIIIPLPPAGRTRVYQGRLHQGTGRHYRLYSRHHRRMQRSASGLRLLLFLQFRHPWPLHKHFPARI